MNVMTRLATAHSVSPFFWQLSNAGGRLIIASDGVWDALSSEKAAVCCRGLQQPEVAAKHIVKVEKYA
jgi:serine/threonine protein phosphatase PrpC